ncbi:MAG: insulinase family protein [bacterium]|nr:insulinase family protein [bacterium]
MNLRRIVSLFGLAALLAVAPTVALAAPAAGVADLPELKFEKYTLENGLQVILHEDHSLPTAAVNVWYHVGSKNEKPGRTGFAHLFEHMMFQGSENHDKDYFLPLQKVGGQVNGSTNNDRTNYWENVPSDQLEMALFLEADRMGWLLPAMTQEKLDNQRDVVKNEKRQGENRPYAKSRDLLLGLMYPEGHPYSWPVIGSMEDLSAASKEDVSEFFRLYYAPNNASLCVAGDFDLAQVKEWIAKYFGTIPPGSPVDRLESWIPQLDGERRALAEDAVELPRLYMQWHSPGWYQEGDAEFDLLGDIVASGKTSRLYKTLVYEKQIAQDIFATQSSREMSGTFGITATAAPGHDLAELEAAIDAELKTLLAKGVTDREVGLSRTRFQADAVRELQQIGGFGGKADRLNRYNVLVGDPGFLKADLARYDAANAASVNAWMRRFIDLDRRGVLWIVPQGKLAAAKLDVDRSQLPAGGRPAAFTPPAVQAATLPNGLKLYLVEKHELPLVEARLVVNAGWADDPLDRQGTAALTADMLDEGVAGRDALALSGANAAVVVVGDLTLAEATAAVSRVLGNWRNASTPKRVPLPETGYQGPRLVVIDRPGAQQSQIMGGYVGMPRGDADFPGFEVLNSAFGGQFASRINLNLREDKGYTYGVRSQLAAYRQAGVFLMSAPVQTNATAASISELLAEMRQARGDRPVAGDELADSKGRLVQGFPQRFETFGGTARQLADLLVAGLPVDDWQSYVGRIQALGEEDLAAVVARHLDPERVVWVIVGDWAAIQDGLRGLELGEIEVVGAPRS